MRKTIYLHIGMPKTGTSSIQRFLYENRMALEKKNVFYPPVLCKPNGVFVTQPEEVVNLKVLYWKALHRFNIKDKASKQNLYDCWNKTYLPLINASNADNVILSAEELLINGNISYWPTLMEMIKEQFNIKIIAYLRKPAEYAVSLWGELTKTNKFTPLTCRLDQWLTRPMRCNSLVHPIPYNDLKYIISLFGAENVIVRPFEKCQFKNGDLIADFLDIFNLELTSELKVLEPENESYNRNCCEFAVLINKLNLPSGKKEELHSKLSAKGNNPKLIETLPDECIEQITIKYEKTLKELAGIYGKESFFKSDYPDCYKKDRPAYDSAVFGLEELEFLHDAIDHADSFLAKDMRTFIKLKYYCNRILFNFAPPKKRDKYKKLKKFYKRLLDS